MMPMSPFGRMRPELPAGNTSPAGGGGFGSAGGRAAGGPQFSRGITPSSGAGMATATHTAAGVPKVPQPGAMGPGMSGRIGAMFGGGQPGAGPTSGQAGNIASMFRGGGGAQQGGNPFARMGGPPQGGRGGGGFAGMFGRGAQQPSQQMGNPFARQPAPQMAPRPGFLGMLSDERSKARIRELEDARDNYRDLMETDRDATSDAFRGVHNYDYDYKPEFRAETGVTSGRGPMAHELRPLGVTRQGPDGLERVDRERLPLKTAGEVGTQRREIDELRARLAELEDNPDAVLDVAGGRR